MIVGFTGKLGSGKDTAGERLAAMVAQGMAAERLSFAAKLKESAAALFGIDPLDWETYKNDPEVKVFLTNGYTDIYGLGIQDAMQEPNVVVELTAREFLQRYGTESHRNVFGRDFWVEQAVKDLRRVDNTLYYFTDVRFVNEAEAIRGRDGWIVKVVGADDETGGHVSEAGIPDYINDHTIRNDVRDDDFANLDSELRLLAKKIGLSLKVEALA